MLFYLVGAMEHAKSPCAGDYSKSTKFKAGLKVAS